MSKNSPKIVRIVRSNENRTPVGWYIRADGRYLLIRQLHLLQTDSPVEIISDKVRKTEDFSGNHPDVEYLITDSVPLGAVLPFASFALPGDISLITRVGESYLAEIALRDELECLKAARLPIIDQMAQIAKLHRRLDEINDRQKDVEAEIDLARKMTQPFMYAYGKHDNNDREFCWRVPNRLKSLVYPGVRCVCETALGDAEMTVTRVENSFKAFPHKYVKCIKIQHGTNHGSGDGV